LEPDLDSAFAGPGAALADGDSASDEWWLGTAIASRVDRGRECFASANIVQALAESRFVALDDQVLEPELHRIHSDTPRNFVHVRLDREYSLGLARRAHETARDGIGVHERGINARVGDSIRSGGLVGAGDRAIRLECRVRAGIDHVIHRVRSQRSVALHTG